MTAETMTAFERDQWNQACADMDETSEFVFPGTRADLRLIRTIPRDLSIFQDMTPVDTVPLFLLA